MIKVYSKPNCMQCKFAKEHLKNKGVQFTEIDVTSSRGVLHEFKEQGFSNLPVILSDNRKPIVGFQIDKLNELVEEINGE